VNKDNGSGGGAPATHHSSRTVVGKPRLGKMAQILSKTMTLLGVAFVIHFIIMSTFAEKEGKDYERNFKLLKARVVVLYGYVCIIIAYTLRLNFLLSICSIGLPRCLCSVVLEKRFI